MLMRIKSIVQHFLHTRFGSFLWQMISSALILAVAAGIGIFAAYAKTEGSSKTYAKDYFKYFMTHSWSLMYAATDLENTKYINQDSFAEMMKNIVPSRGSDKYKFVERGSDGDYNIIDVVYQETGSDIKQTMTLRMKKKEEKTFLVLDQWEVCLSQEILRDCTITAPININVTLDGVSLADANYVDDLDAGLRTYILDKVLAGKHTVELSGTDTKSTYETFLWEGSKSSYAVQTTEIPLTDRIIQQCSEQTIDMVIGMYTGVLTNSGCDAVKNFLLTEEDKAGADAMYAALLAQVNQDNGATLISMTFDSYDTAMTDYVYGQSFGIQFNFGTTFTAKEARTQMSGVRKTYDGTAQGTAMVRFECREGQWVPVGMEMNCFDYSKPQE